MGLFISPDLRLFSENHSLFVGSLTQSHLLTWFSSFTLFGLVLKLVSNFLGGFTGKSNFNTIIFGGAFKNDAPVLVNRSWQRSLKGYATCGHRGQESEIQARPMMKAFLLRFFFSSHGDC